MTTNFELIIASILLFSSFIIVYKECSCFVAEYYDFKRYYMLLKVRLIGLFKNKYFLSILLINFLSTKSFKSKLHITFLLNMVSP